MDGSNPHLTLESPSLVESKFIHVWWSYSNLSNIYPQSMPICIGEPLSPFSAGSIPFVCPQNPIFVGSHLIFFLVKSPFFMIKHIVSHIVSLDPPKFVPFLPLFHGFSRTSKESPGRCGWWSMPSGRGRRGDVRRGTPPVISWFINHSKYRYIYHKP